MGGLNIQNRSASPPSAGNTLSIPQAMELAGQLQGQGRLQEAEQLLRQILQQQPRYPLALHLLGVIAYQCGQPGPASELIGAAIAENGNVALFHANQTEVLRQLKRLDEAVAHGERAVQLEPGMAMAHSNLGIALYDRKDYDRAEACQKRALELQPNLAQSLNNLGSIWRERGDHEAALLWYRKATEADPNYLEPLNNLGALLLEEDRLPEAIEALNKALQLNSNYPDSVCNMGGIHMAHEEYDAALASFTRALELRPAYLEAQMGYARALQSLERLPEAEAAAQEALKLDANSHKAHALLGSIYAEMLQPDLAEAEYQRALEIDDTSEAGLLGLGGLCVENGELDRARKLLQKLLVLKPDNTAARIQMVQTDKVTADDENFAALLEFQKEADQRSPVRRMSLNFALGKCYDDIKDYDQAFPHYLEGNKMKRARINYDPVATARQFSELRAIFDADAVARLEGGGDPSSLPIFVLGMPRSGTTLTEQIIASHPDVFGAGELHDLLQIAHRKTAPSTTDFPDNLRYLNHETLAAWGAEYVAGLQQRSPEAKHITDKMPANFFAVPLIHLMMPNAKIIHVNRNPVDTCLSCFTHLFKGKLEYTYDLAELGRYYADYARMMQQWREVLPAGAFLDVQYEEIVADQEAQARRMLEFCGLEWNDACLDFHNTKRQVRTASVTQVRQPIYKTSVERWRKYEKFLGPLLAELGDLVPGSV